MNNTEGEVPERESCTKKKIEELENKRGVRISIAIDDIIREVMERKKGEKKERLMDGLVYSLLKECRMLVVKGTEASCGHRPTIGGNAETAYPR